VGKSGSLDAGDQGVEQFFVLRLGVFQVPLNTFGDLSQVVRGNVGRHTHGDAGGTVDQQIGEPGRKDHGFLVLAVVVVLEVDGVFLDVPHHFHGQWRHLALGIPRCSGAVVAG
jgi:hypothetical protein